MELPDMLDYFYVVSYSIKVLHTTTDGSLSHVLAVWCWARDYHAAAAATGFYSVTLAFRQIIGNKADGGQ